MAADHVTAGYLLCFFSTGSDIVSAPNQRRDLAIGAVGIKRLTIDSFPETQTANSGTCQPLLRNAVIISNSFGRRRCTKLTAAYWPTAKSSDYVGHRDQRLNLVLL